MPSQILKKTGRPARFAVDILRGSAWAHAIWSGRKDTRRLAEAIGCETQSRAADRFYKYQRGLSTPPATVVARVDKVLKGSALIYDHPLWELVRAGSMNPDELRFHVQRLPEFGEWLIDKDLPARSKSPFWRSPMQSHRDVVGLVLAVDTERRHPLWNYLGRTAVLAALIHDALHRQRQVQHFEAHVALVRHLQTTSEHFRAFHPWTGRAEAMLAERWLDTEYRIPLLQKWMKHLRSIDHSDVHLTLASKLASSDVAKEKKRLQALRGRWVLEAVGRRPPVLTLPADG